MNNTSVDNLPQRDFFKSLKEGVWPVQLIISEGEVAKRQVGTELDTLAHTDFNTSIGDDKLTKIFQNAEEAANSDLINILTTHLEEGKQIDDEVKLAFTNLELLVKANRVISTGKPVYNENPEVTLTKAINAFDGYFDHAEEDERFNVKTILQRQARGLGQRLTNSPPLTEL